MKFGKFKLIDNTINDMKEGLRNTINTNKEHGFALCADISNNVIGRNYVIGEMDYVNTPRKCEKDEKFLGTFHTHSIYSEKMKAGLSSSDIRIACTDGHACLGSAPTNRIRCYIRKRDDIEGCNTDLDNYLKEAREISSKIKTEADNKITRAILDRKRTLLTNKHFDEIKIK